MSEELKSFLQSLRTKPELLEELRSRLQDPDAAIQWAREQGCHLTPDDITELRGDQELSDDELDKVAGGDTAWPPPPPPPGP
ncbi:MAG TPA: Nif11-like leader peptide family RiPP precursor [Thermoanaerobaculia bacterium]|jgi:predicted ribosomally synthesized peptide with nif11-like leader|nr:Nif11-like leader peptide family RiPP precursor [Thermoanaerobaculia bacterium]